MIPVPWGVRAWLAAGVIDMQHGQRGISSLALQVQEGLAPDPYAGDLSVFRGREGHPLKDSLARWHDGQGVSLYFKRLERERFLWPPPAAGAVAITPAHLGYLLTLRRGRLCAGEAREDRPCDWSDNGS